MSSTPQQRILKATLPSSLSAYHDFVQDVMAALTELQWPKQPDQFAIHMALEESISNAIRHGNCEDDAKQVEVECRIDPQHFWAQVCDEGDGFCPKHVPDCRQDDRIEVPGGRGLTLIRAYMSNVEHNEAGNCLTFSRKLGEQPQVKQ